MADVQAERPMAADRLSRAIETLFGSSTDRQPWVKVQQEQVQSLENELRRREAETLVSSEHERQASITAGLARVQRFRDGGDLPGLRQAQEELRGVLPLLHEDDPQRPLVQQDLAALQQRCNDLEEQQATTATREQWRVEMDLQQRAAAEQLARANADGDFAAVLQALGAAHELARKLQDKTTTEDLARQMAQACEARVRLRLRLLETQMNRAATEAAFATGVTRYIEAQKLATDAPDAALQADVTNALRAAQQRWAQWRLAEGRKALGVAITEEDFDAAAGWFTKTGELAEQIGDHALMSEANRWNEQVHISRRPETQAALQQKLAELEKIETVRQRQAEVDAQTEQIGLSRPDTDQARLLAEALHYCLVVLDLQPGHAQAQARMAAILDALERHGRKRLATGHPTWP